MFFHKLKNIKNMNQPIMRRGLSPEGRRIWQKHQGSLLNDEYGVTSRPVHKKIEKDFLKENVMRLKEIQAKCRVQESRPNSGCQPIKAVRHSSLSDRSIIHPKGMINIGDGISNEDRPNLRLKLREDSTHSDYFSLPDESNHENVPTQMPSDSESEIETGGRRTCGRDLTKLDEKKQLMDEEETQINNEIRRLAPKLNFESEDKFPLQLDLNNGFNQEDSQLLKIKKDKRSELSLPIRRSRMSNIIENIKSKPAACETNVEFIWRDIKKEHKALFMKEDCPSVITLGTVNAVQPGTNNLKSARGSSNQEKSSLLVRSKSLDRSSNVNKASKPSNISSSTFTLNARPKSKSSTKLIGLEPKIPSPSNDKNMLLHKEIASRTESFREHSESLPNLCDASEVHPHPQSTNALCNNSGNVFYGNSSSVSLHCDENNFDSARNENFHFKDRPKSTEQIKCREMSVDDRNRKEGNNCSSQIEETNSLGISGKQVTPLIITKKNCSDQKLKHQCERNLLRSKSTTNLHLSGEPPPTYKRGQIPRYLKTRKAEAQRRLEAAAAIDPMCPPGHTPIPDHERRNTLQLLKKGQGDVMMQLSSLPLAQDTLRVRQVKRELEAKLQQIDEGIEIFSQPKVYVVNDD